MTGAPGSMRAASARDERPSAYVPSRPRSTRPISGARRAQGAAANAGRTAAATRATPPPASSTIPPPPSTTGGTATTTRPPGSNRKGATPTPAQPAGVVVDRGAAMEARHGRESKERLVEQRVTEETRLLAHDGDEPRGDDQHGGRHRGGDGSGGSPPCGGRQGAPPRHPSEQR